MSASVSPTVQSIRVGKPIHTNWDASPGGGAEGGAAGGVLAGTFPNPTFAQDMATQAELNTHVSASSPHPAYDDLPSLTLLFQNGLV